MPNTDRIEKRVELKAPPVRVWQALTDYREFSAWFGVNLQSPFVSGEATRGNITYPGYEHLTMEVWVEKMERERTFSFRWHPYAVDPEVDYSRETPTVVEFTLAPMEGGTLLTVVETGFDSLPESRRAEAFRMNDSGWEEQWENLEKYLADSR